MADGERKVVYFLGRSGHGKSSILNAVTNKDLAEIGHVAPTTPCAQEHFYNPMDGTSQWTLVDSRGIFETTRPTGATPVSPSKQIELDLKKYDPNVIVYVVSCPEVRNLSNDLPILRAALEQCSKSNNPSVVVVLNKVDAIGLPYQWPPENDLTKKELLNKLMTYMAKDVLQATLGESIKPEDGLFGCELLLCRPFCYIVPVSALQVKPKLLWNIETLRTAILRGFYKGVVKRRTMCHVM